MVLLEGELGQRERKLPSLVHDLALAYLKPLTSQPQLQLPALLQFLLAANFCADHFSVILMQLPTVFVTVTI